MLGTSLSSPVYTCAPATPRRFPTPFQVSNVGVSPKSLTRLSRINDHSPRRWPLRSTSRTAEINLTDEQRNSWETCKEALSEFSFSSEEEDKILGKAFGHIHSPYWSEERKVEVPKRESVTEVLDYLRSLTLSDEDLQKVLKKFPEVLGCDLEDEVKNNVALLEKNWGISGKTLRNLLVRNPKVLGFTVDCKGDCIAQCTRCWVRF